MQSAHRRTENRNSSCQKHTPLPTTPNIIIDDIERMVLHTIQSLLPRSDKPDDTDITNPDLATTVAASLNSYIDTVTSTTTTTFKTAHTNELTLYKISAASVALNRTIKLNKIEADHKHLLDQHAFLTQQIEVVLARQSNMGSVLSASLITTHDTSTLTCPSPTLLPTDHSHPSLQAQEHRHEPAKYLNIHTSRPQQDNKRSTSYQSYRPDSTNQHAQ